METVLFCVPLKPDSLADYEKFAAEHVARADEYREMMARYDIKCARIWHRKFHDCDYLLVYHKVGPQFRSKMETWEESEHSFDVWFRENMMAFYDIEAAAEMSEPRQIIDFS